MAKFRVTGSCMSMTTASSSLVTAKSKDMCENKYVNEDKDENWNERQVKYQLFEVKCKGKCRHFILFRSKYDLVS